MASAGASHRRGEGQGAAAATLYASGSAARAAKPCVAARRALCAACVACVVRACRCASAVAGMCGCGAFGQVRVCGMWQGKWGPGRRVRCIRAVAGVARTGGVV